MRAQASQGQARQAEGNYERMKVDVDNIILRFLHYYGSLLLKF
jgi:hypothetical protein